MWTFGGMDRWVPAGGLDSLGQLLERAFRNFQVGLNGSLELPDREPTRGTRLGRAVPGNIRAEIVEVTFEAHDTEAQLETSFGFLVDNAALVWTEQPFIVAPGDTPAGAKGPWRKAMQYHDGTSVVTVYPFKARFLVWGAPPERLT